MSIGRLEKRLQKLKHCYSFAWKHNIELLHLARLSENFGKSANVILQVQSFLYIYVLLAIGAVLLRVEASLLPVKFTGSMQYVIN